MKKTLAAIMLAVSLAACGPTPQAVTMPDGTTQQVTPNSSGPGWLGAAGAGVLGYMMGKSAGRNQAMQAPTYRSPPVIIQRPVVPNYTPRYSPPMPRTYSPPTRSYGSGSISRSAPSSSYRRR